MRIVLGSASGGVIAFRLLDCSIWIWHCKLLSSFDYFSCWTRVFFLVLQFLLFRADLCILVSVELIYFLNSAMLALKFVVCICFLDSAK